MEASLHIHLDNSPDSLTQNLTDGLSAASHGLGLHTTTVNASDPHVPQRLAEAFKVGPHVSFGTTVRSSQKQMAARVGRHDLERPDVYPNQIVAVVFLPSHVLGPPTLAAHCLVGEHDLHPALVLRGDRLLHIPVLACKLVLETVLRKVPHADFAPRAWTVRCNDRRARRSASDIWSHI